LKDLLLTYIESLRKIIRLEKVILYGSYAEGHPHSGSDLVVIFFDSYRVFQEILPALDDHMGIVPTT